MYLSMMAMLVQYGPHPDQTADLYLPEDSRPPVVVLLHGGFWRMPYGRDQLNPVAQELVKHGYAVWNLGYRRVGAPGVSWKDTLDDVLTGIRHVARLDNVALDLERVIVVGHSAGGHLALWAAAQSRRKEIAGEVVGIAAVVGLAAVSDLVEAWKLDLGKGAVAQLLAAAPDEEPDRYRSTSPRALLPIDVRQELLHGAQDSAVPLSMSRDYIAAASAAGDDAELYVLPESGHMDFLDPLSGAFAMLLARLEQLSRR